MKYQQAKALLDRLCDLAILFHASSELRTKMFEALDEHIPHLDQGCFERGCPMDDELSRCPKCGGPADNGHDRSIPPNPYLCTKCMAEMPQPSYNVTVVDDAHPNGIPLEQWQNKPVKLTPWRCACGANLYIDAQGRPASKAEPVQEPVATVVARQYDDGTYAGNALDWAGRNCEDDFPVGTKLYTAPPQRKPLSLTDLQEALVLTNLIDRDAIEDSEEYDEGSTLAQIDELYRIIIKE